MDLTNLSKKLEEVSFLTMTIAQIHKDFRAIGVEANFNSSDKRGLTNEIASFLGGMSPDKHIQLAYIVDIGEEKMRKWLSKGAELEEFSNMILHREALKILIRLNPSFR